MRERSLSVIALAIALTYSLCSATPAVAQDPAEPGPATSGPEMQPPEVPATEVAMPPAEAGTGAMEPAEMKSGESESQPPSNGRPAAADPAPSDDPFAGVHRLDRETLVAAVLERNPDLTAMRQAWEAARQRVPQVTSLPDPQLSWSVAPLSIAESDVDLGQIAQFRQPFPYPGKLELRGEAAEAMADSEHRRWESLRLDLARMAADLLYDLYLVDRSLEINREHIRLLEELKEIATARYSSGLVAQQVPLQAEVELTHLVHREISLETQRDVVASRINALLHRRPGLPLPPPADLAASAPDLGALGDELPTAIRWDERTGAAATGAADSARPAADLGLDLAEAALGNRPELRAVDAEIRARETERELAGLERKPDFGLLAGYNVMRPNDEHHWTVGVSLDLPIRRQRIRAGEAEADARLDSARYRRRALADRVRSEVRQALDRLAELVRVTELYDSRLLPAARDQLRAARSGFETGQVSFLSVVEAERNLRSVELGYEQTVTDRHRRRADLERALGLAPGEPLPVAIPESADTSPTAANEELAAPAAGGTR